MSGIYTPDEWAILKIETLSRETIYKVVGSWYGGYLDSDKWRINSGIERIELSDNRTKITFYGYSESEYVCLASNYGISSYAQSIVNRMISHAEVHGNRVKLLDRLEAKEYILSNLKE